MTGYLNANYAASLAEFGKPRQLPECGGWILERQIPNLPARDGMSCYPLFCCQDWSKLHLDLDNMGKELVSLSIVTDPFGNYDDTYLSECFKDKVIPFKKHFIIDLHQPIDEFVSTHHRRNVRKALSNVDVEICQQPLIFIDDWVNLYNILIERHQIKGIQKFSKLSFTEQFQIPGISVFRAYQKDITMGMILWYQQNDVGYYHLAAYSDSGYELKTSFALFWYAIKHFTNAGLRWLNLGAGAGVQSNSKDGLTRFKEGWSTGTKTAYFCGRIFDHNRYSEITKAKGILTNDYFPAYRKGEFS